MLAFLQYTSGTTGLPKGVAVTHQNIMCNSAQLQKAMGYNQASRVVSVGNVEGNTKIAIVDPQTHILLDEKKVGEIWIKGDSIAHGYWNNPTLSGIVFKAFITDGNGTAYLRSSDLGFISAGELYITGRIDDHIVIDHRHHYPQAIEWSATHAHPALAKYGAAAFTIDKNNRLIIALEINLHSRRNINITEIETHVRHHIEREHALDVHEIILTKPHPI